MACELDKTRSFSQDVILDDRGSTTIGKKLMEAKRVGYPYIVVVGKKSIEQVPLIELYDVNRNTHNLYTVAKLFEYLTQCES